MGFLAALVALAGPIVARVLLALGFSVVTVVGVTATFEGIKATVLEKLGGLDPAWSALVGLAGGWEALGVVFGAITWALTFYGLTKATRILGNGGASA